MLNRKLSVLRAAAVAVTAGLLITGCGGGDDDSKNDFSNNTQNNTSHKLAVSSTNLPQVSALDLSRYPLNSTWLKTEEVVFDYEVDDSQLNLLLEKREIGYLTQANGEYAIDSCNQAERKSLAENPVLDKMSFECNSSISYRYYQHDDQFSVTTLCADQVVYALTLAKYADEKIANFGEVEINIENDTDVAEYNNTCGTFVETTTRITTHQSDPLTVKAYSVAVNVPYKNDRLNLIVSSDSDNLGNYPFEPFSINSDAVNYFVLESSQLNTLSYNPAHDGSFTFFARSENSAEGRFDVTITNNEFNDEVVTGELKINIQP